MVRNKVITGLMVFQGLLPDEIRQLEVKDLQPEKGKISVPASKRKRNKGFKLRNNTTFFYSKIPL